MLDTANGSKAQGIEVVRPAGRRRTGWSISTLAEAAIDDETALVAVMLVNNEIGVDPAGRRAGAAGARQRAR